MTVVIRRRIGLVAGVALSAAALAAAYLWRFATHSSGVALLVGVVLGVIAVLHGCAWSSARTPLLVADDTGLRIRLGSAWTGVPWGQVERVEVDERGRLSDGHVAVHVADEAAALAGADGRSRLSAWCNAKMYGVSLAVPYGLATNVTTDNVAGELGRLAQGRAEVIIGDADPERPEPSVEITTGLGAAETASSDEAGAQEVSPFPPLRPVQQEPGPVSSPQPARHGPGVAAREVALPLPLRRVVSALRSQPARREEVTLAMRREATEGMLALSAATDEDYTEELPEIAELRRHDENHDALRDGAVGGNIALIIDATTDMSARAMKKVRTVSPRQDVVEDSDTARGADVARADKQVTLGIGGQLRQARETLGLSVDDLADRTRIRPFVIECMEADDFSPCGGDFYARGHLRMLSRVLGIAAEPLIATYDATLATSPIGPRAVFDIELATGTTGMVRGGAAGANWGGLIAAVLILLLVWGVARFFADSSSLAPATSPTTQNAAGLGSPGIGNKPIPSPPDAHVQLTASGGDSPILVRDRFKAVLFRGVLRDGQSKKLTGEAPLHVVAGNAGVISLSVKGHRLGAMGETGQRANVRITANPLSGGR